MTNPKRVALLSLFVAFVLPAGTQAQCDPASSDALGALVGQVADKGDPAPTVPSTQWQEVFTTNRGAITTPDGEQAEFALAGRKIGEMQQRLRAANAGEAVRVFHTEALWMGAVEFTVYPSSQIPEFARHGLFAKGGETFAGRARFSNSSSVPTPDKDFQARGLAFEVDYDGKVQSFLANTPKTLPGANGWDFMALAQAAVDATVVGGVKGQAGLPISLFKYVQETLPEPTNLVDRTLILAQAETKKLGMLAALAKGAAEQKLNPHESLGDLKYWSAAPIKVGPYAARYRYVPHPDNAEPIPPADPKDISDNYLGEELRGQLEKGDVKYILVLEMFVNDDATPIEDSTQDWDGGIQVPVGELTIKQGTAHDESLDGHRFSVWNHADGFRPLSNMNRIRKPVYNASAAGRGARQP